ncbi:DUF1289 domain-containing protein [Vogesella indigofera]|uniref:DUF1289 domain-containing protein n=1 Tax=Vogesella indigofera TaxID=45465 RepID=UPI00234C1A93|nr:DUF1289 domain-containing protein [Vogesella indigofera]MDC7704966.1 DUF1289 domain-containing protein [Vogesella indigofera]
MIATPCIGVCSTAVGDEVCFGCGRSFAEVSDWLTLSDAQRAAIQAQLSRRKVWLQMAMQSGGRLQAILPAERQARLALTPSVLVTLGWPQQRQGRGYVPLLTHDGRSYLLPVYRDDWLRLFWNCLFDADCAPLN